MKSDINTEADIKRLVDSFYEKVLVDPQIGHIFTDVAQNLAQHMPKLYAFWNSVILGSGSYNGNPMRVHIDLHQRTPLEPEHFQQWLKLWESTIHEMFEGPKAAQTIQKAKNIADLMLFKISAFEAKG